ncbi:mitogen-activated protein kinase kinase kinase 4-like [Anneissia japonica]|uniref:mitogen-activated protein kinase kinase kinase 4-like n=1 Tax=Anneissia japonica TaxID=1529436 RepID=UPI001425A604|nr:mitogen-activated protein kinase kinase kinase 4-like [Anneissia japonica]
MEKENRDSRFPDSDEDFEVLDIEMDATMNLGGMYEDDDGPFHSIDMEIHDNLNLSRYSTTPPVNHREQKRYGKQENKTPKVVHAGGKHSTSRAQMGTVTESNFSPVVRRNSQEAMTEDAKEALKKKKRDIKKERNHQREEKISIRHNKNCIITPSHSQEVMSINNRTSYSSNRYQSLTYLQVSPPISPNTTTKKRQSSIGNQLVECPKDRLDFHRTFSYVIKMGASNSKKEKSHDITRLKVQRQNSQQQEFYQTQTAELIWLALQAWQNCVEMEQQDKLLMTARSKAKEIVDRILKFSFEPIGTGIQRSKSLQNSTTPILFEKDFDDEENSSSNSSHIPHSLSDSHIDQSREQTVFSEACEPKTSILRRSSLAFGYEVTALMKMIQLAHKQIGPLLCDLENVQKLYISSKALEKDIPEFTSEAFIRQVNTLNLWINITIDISHKLKLLGSHLGVYDSGNWPGIEYDGRYSITNNSSIIKPYAKKSGRLSLPSVREDSLDSHDHEPQVGDNSSTYSPISKPVAMPPVPVATPSPVATPTTPVATPTTPVATSTPATTPTTPKPGRFSPMTRIFSSCHFSFDEENSTWMYRPYVDSGLKHKGLEKTMIALQSIIGPTLTRAKMAMERVSVTGESTDLTKGDEFPSHPCLDTSSANISDVHTSCFIKHGCHSEEFKAMNLPSFRHAYVFLLRVLLDVMHECLHFRLAQKPAAEAEPSIHSINQLIHECKEVIRWAVWIKEYYHRMVQAVVNDSQDVDTDIEEYEENLKNMLDVYFEYIHIWMSMLQRSPRASASLKNILEEEWAFSKEFCPHIRSGESKAGKRFCIMASNLLESTREYLEAETDDICSGLQDSTLYPENIIQSTRDSSRGIKQLFYEARERASRALSFAKMLRKDLEIAAEFHLSVSTKTLLKDLCSSNHVRVLLDSPGHMLFVPQHVEGKIQQIRQLLSDLCGREDFIQSSPSSEDGYLLLVKTDDTDWWPGKCIDVTLNVERTIALVDIQVENLLLVVNHSSQLSSQRKAFEKAVGSDVALVIETTSSHNTIADALSELKTIALTHGETLTSNIYKIRENLDIDAMHDIHQTEKLGLYFRETMHKCFAVGFEYHKEVARLLSGELRQRLGKTSLAFAISWMKFVVDKCEKGKGRKPRWAQHGLDFLIIACDPKNIAHLEDDEFQDLKKLMNQCIHHVIGAPPISSCPASPAPIHRPSSPTPESIGMTKPGLRSIHSTPGSPVPSDFQRNNNDLFRPVYSPSEERLEPNFKPVEKRSSPISFSDKLPHPRIVQMRKSLKTLEEKRMKKLQDDGVIGHVSNHSTNNNAVFNCRKVKFRWQRGFKIGEGQQGTTVYSCINMDTGETLAVKEIRLQRFDDHSALRDLADEIKIFESIIHPNLVKYYGVEIHREELLIFMEYCDDGTLGEAAEDCLPEDMIRHYMYEIVTAVSVLHENGIIHRDIKGANIFLSSDGHLKLGDFGSAIKLSSRQTLPGEISEYLGTPAYMAPEVIKQSEKKEGYGRASDIWSIGCVLIEMLTGKRPWHEYRHEYSIVYKVGDGAIPKIPEAASEEAKDFLHHCLQHNPEDRWTANRLLEHPFIKVS